MKLWTILLGLACLTAASVSRPTQSTLVFSLAFGLVFVCGRESAMSYPVSTVTTQKQKGSRSVLFGLVRGEAISQWDVPESMRNYTVPSGSGWPPFNSLRSDITEFFNGSLPSFVRLLLHRSSALTELDRFCFSNIVLWTGDVFGFYFCFSFLVFGSTEFSRFIFFRSGVATADPQRFRPGSPGQIPPDDSIAGAPLSHVLSKATQNQVKLGKKNPTRT